LRAISKLDIPTQYQRFQYFAALHGKWLSDAQLTQLALMENQDKQGLEHSWRNALLEKFDDFEPDGEKPDLFQFPAPIRPLAAKLLSLTGKGPNEGNLEKTVKDGLLSGLYQKDRPAYYWENDHAWTKIRSLVLKEDGAIAVVGNLVGDRAFKSLGKFLMENGDHVSAIDVSNATEFLDPHYVVDWDRILSPETEQAAKAVLEKLKNMNQKFLENIFLLSLSSDAILIKTDGGGYNTENVASGKVQMVTDPNTDFWEYSWRKIEDMRKDFKIGDWDGTLLPSPKELIKMGGTSEQAKRLELLKPYFRSRESDS